MPNWANNGEQWWAIDRQIVCPRYRIRFQTHPLPETDTKSVRGNKRKERKSDRTEATPKELFQFSSTYASLITLSLSLSLVLESPLWLITEMAYFNVYPREINEYNSERSSFESLSAHLRFQKLLPLQTLRRRDEWTNKLTICWGWVSILKAFPWGLRKRFWL